jgi:hypothetical protein
MNLAELDQAAADLVREYANTDDGQCAIVIRTYGTKGKVRVICLSLDRSLLANYLNKAADVIFDGQHVQTRTPP